MEDINYVEKLSAEEAYRSPEEFKDRLIRAVENHTEFGGSVWAKLNRAGIILLTDVILENGTWISETRAAISESDRNTIHLGVKPLPGEIATKVFPHRKMSEPETIVHKFTHELAHQVAYQANQKSEKFKQLYLLAQDMRSQGHGFSGLGSLDFYHNLGGPTQQATEDVVELLNMLIKGQNYLASYLNFLGDPQFENERRSLGLASFSDNKARELLEEWLLDGLNVFLLEGVR